MFQANLAKYFVFKMMWDMKPFIATQAGTRMLAWLIKYAGKEIFLVSNKLMFSVVQPS